MQVSMGTQDAAASTIKKRSQLIEKLQENVAVGSVASKKEDLIEQQVKKTTTNNKLYTLTPFTLRYTNII